MPDFKQKFKYFKSKNPPPDLNEVLDLHNNYEACKNKVLKIKLTGTHANIFGLIPPLDWEVYEIIGKPGLIYVKNPFTNAGQKYWVTRCLRDYTKSPNKSNLDAHNFVPPGENWWSFCCETADDRLVQKLRWVTLGYHHNWDTKVYSESCKNDMPGDLVFLCEHIAGLLNFCDFKAQAAIVNYYHLDSTLSGHTDHSEEDLDAPLLSFSFGQSAIFLIGGETLEVEPVALFLHSGDILVMSKQSRLFYHGVPKIIRNDKPIWDDHNETVNDENFDETTIEFCKRDEFWKPYQHYLCNSRININVRQVLRKGQNKLSDG